MSAPKAPSSSRQDFLLGPDRTRSNLSSLHSGGARDPKVQKEKMSMFKRHLASSRLRSDEAIRRKVEMLKEQRSLSNLSKSGIQKDMEAVSKARMEEELGRPVSSNEWPFVYFVVTLDQLPREAEEMNNTEHSTRMSQTARERQRFLTSRRRKIQEAREETERIREAGIDMGLRLEPIKPAQVPDHSTMSKIRTRPSLSKHPTTPVSSIGSRADFSFLNSQDDLADAELTKRNLGYLIHDTLSQAGMPPKTGRHCPISSLELPEISASAKRKALGTSNKSKNHGLGERKVTFAEGLPVIKGNGIPVNNNNNNNNIGSVVSQSCPAAPTSDFVKSHVSTLPESRERSGKDSSNRRPDDESLRPPWSVPTTRSLNSFGQKSRLFAPMALPKVDIVSEIYDELIVKTIQNYLLAEGYGNDKLQQLRQTVLARLSATYPHLVKHRAWRLTHSPCDKLYTNEEEGEEVVMADPDRLQPRARMQGRFNKVVVDSRGLTYDQMRPFTSPHTSPVDNSNNEPPITQSFMAIDGRTMTFSSREELRFRSAGGGTGTFGVAPSTPYSRLPTTAEERNGEGGGEDFEFENVNPNKKGNRGTNGVKNDVEPENEEKDENALRDNDEKGEKVVESPNESKKDNGDEPETVQNDKSDTPVTVENDDNNYNGENHDNVQNNCEPPINDGGSISSGGSAGVQE